jgi:hypothetical protein
VDVGEWLNSLDLGQYEAAFPKNDVDVELLPRLTADVLGTTSVGHRRRLLDAVAKNRMPAHPRRQSSHRAITRHRHRQKMWFRQVVNAASWRWCSATWSVRPHCEKLDPEELRDLLHTYRTLCGDVTARNDGFVARYVGDGILTHFRWPVAHEEDAERAVRAAPEIVHTVKRTSWTEDLAVRIGIATGPVVVGEPAGAGAGQSWR